MDRRTTFEQALQLHKQGKLVDAERAYRSVLVDSPFHAGALHNLGLIARDTGQIGPALDLVRQAVALDSANVGFRATLVGLLDRAGRRDEAEQTARALANERPADLRLRGELARLLTKYRRFDDASAEWERILHAAPNDAGALLNSGLNFERMGDAVRAEARYRALLAIDPTFGPALSRLGALALSAGEPARAAELLQRARTHLPNDPEVLSNLATALLMVNRLDEARTHAKAATELDPQSADVLSAYANVLVACGDVEAAADAHSRAVAVARHPLEYYSDYLLTRTFLEATGEEELRLHRGFNDLCVRKITPRPPAPRTLAPGERLRIGYVSADFRTHPVGLFVEPLLAHHDRTRFEVHCFSSATLPDGTTQRIRESVDAFHDLPPRTTFDTFDERVRCASIDILIDLGGHTGANCLQLFARKPAPVQISYLGYPNTTGLDAIDFRISDCITDPPGLTDAFHSETLLRLPMSFGLFRPPPHAPEIGPSPVETNGYMTFGTLGRVEKWSRATLESWAHILERVPLARFRLIGGGYDDPAYANQLLTRLEAFGIDRSRVDLVGHRPFDQYLAELSRFDLLLDTNPFNCHTTTLQALYMGVPTVTRTGPLSRSRMGASVMTALGLDALIARDTGEYEAIATEHAKNPAQLIEWRTTLRRRLLDSSLCDGAGFARAFEACLIEAWEKKTGQTIKTRTP